MITAAVIALAPSVAAIYAATVNFLRTRRIEARVDHEFTNNGGSSARDVLDLLVVKVERIDDKLDAHIAEHERK